MSSSCQATTIKAGVPLMWAKVNKAELGPLSISQLNSVIQFSNLTSVGRGRRGQGGFDLKAEEVRQ